MKYFKAGILVLLLCIISGIQSGTVYGEEYNGFLYGVNEDEEVYIYEYTGNEEHLVIPAEIEGYPVTEVDIWSNVEGSATKTITIPSSVVSFNTYYFTALTDIFVDEGNENYKSIDGALYSKDGTALIKCPEGRKGRFEIAEGAVTFENAGFSSGITEIYIPESFTDIETLLMNNNLSSMEKIEVSDKNPVLCMEDDILYNKDRTILYKCISVKEGCIDIPENVEVIYDRAFRECIKIDKIVMPDTVNSVGNMAFFGCTSLADVHMSENITFLGSMAFSECTSLKKLIIPSKLVRIYTGTFKGSGICELIIEDGNEDLSFKDGILYGEKGKVLINCLSDVEGEINLPEGLISINAGAFSGCAKITKVTVPDSVTQMGATVFEECSSLKEIRLSQNLIEISDLAFAGCLSLEEIVIPESVTCISSFCFMGCTNLKKIWIESMKVTDLGSHILGEPEEGVAEVYVYDENLYRMFMENESKSYGMNVTLLKKAEPLELSSYNVTLYTGNVKKSAIVKAVLTDVKGTVKWTTSNKSVATVKNGKITAVKKGKAVITAKVGKYKKTVQVTVKNPDIVVADGSESIKTIKLKKGKTVYYRVSVNPKGSKVKTEIGKNAKKMAKISLKNNTLSVKGLKKGTFTFKLKCGQASKKITVKIR